MLLRVFLSQFADLLIVILLIAALISMFSGNAESTIVIAVVLVMNAVLGTVQHQKAEKSLDSLKNLSAPCAKVIREGKKKEIPSRELVPGDLVELEAGDMVVADGRILDNFSLQVNESALTGESTNVEKTQGSLPEDLPLADRRNMVYSGSLVTYGRAQVLVTGTGMHTEILMSMIGLIVVCGIVINDSILKIDTINTLRREGMGLKHAIMEAGRRRLKAIVMTSLTTILAVAPFLSHGDMGSDLQLPMSLTIISGMIVGTLVSVFFIPLAYYEIYRPRR